jgi:cytochrome P450
VIQESLRLFPPAPLNHRLAAGECELGGYRLPAGTEVISSIYHTHRLPEIYADPQQFRPERWQGFEPGPYAFSPFSAGPRACIGASFAMMEMKIVLAMLLQRFRFELVPGSRIDPAITITMAPKYGLPMILHPADGRFSDNRRDVRGKVSTMVDLDSN